MWFCWISPDHNSVSIQRSRSGYRAPKSSKRRRGLDPLDGQASEQGLVPKNADVTGRDSRFTQNGRVSIRVLSTGGNALSPQPDTFPDSPQSPVTLGYSFRPCSPLSAIINHQETV